MDLDERLLKIGESGLLWIALSVLAYPFRRTIFRALLALGLFQVMAAGTLIGLPKILDEWGSHWGLLFLVTSLGLWIMIALYLAKQERKERKAAKL